MQFSADETFAVHMGKGARTKNRNMWQEVTVHGLRSNFSSFLVGGAVWYVHTLAQHACVWRKGCHSFLYTKMLVLLSVAGCTPSHAFTACNSGRSSVSRQCWQGGRYATCANCLLPWRVVCCCVSVWVSFDCPFHLLPSALCARLLWTVSQSVAHPSLWVVSYFTAVMSHKSTGHSQAYVHLSAAA